MDEDPKTYQPRRPGGYFAAGWIILVIVALVLTAGLVLAHAHRLRSQTATLDRERDSGPRVLVVPVRHAPRTRSLDLPGTIHGYIETSVYATVAGDLKTIRVDKGDR